MFHRTCLSRSHLHPEVSYFFISFKVCTHSLSLFFFFLTPGNFQEKNMFYFLCLCSSWCFYWIFPVFTQWVDKKKWFFFRKCVFIFRIGRYKLDSLTRYKWHFFPRDLFSPTLPFFLEITVEQNIFVYQEEQKLLCLCSIILGNTHTHTQTLTAYA